ncbi:hypothetical protein L195_g002505, partial [Trifolium pratense]
AGGINVGEQIGEELREESVEMVDGVKSEEGNKLIECGAF